MSKAVFITGASRGIGYETATAFAKSAYDVGFTYLNSEDAANKLKDSISKMSRCYAYKADVSDYEAMREAISDFISKTSKIDVLVCNAGISPYGQLSDMSSDDIKRAFEVNVYGVINSCKIVSEYMIAKKKGSIITLSSIWGVTGASCESIYSATKGAITAFSKSLAKELGPSNIRVNVVAPGIVMTDMMSAFSDSDIQTLKDMSALGRVSGASEIANTVVFLASDKASSFSGQILSPNNGILI